MWRWRRRVTPIGRGRGGAVERLGDRGPPVDEQALLLVVGEPDAADVEAGFLGPRRQVDPAETQAAFDGPETGQALGVHDGEVVALRPVLVGAERAWASTPSSCARVRTRNGSSRS